MVAPVTYLRPRVPLLLLAILVAAWWRFGSCGGTDDPRTPRRAAVKSAVRLEPSTTGNTTPMTAMGSPASSPKSNPIQTKKQPGPGAPLPCTLKAVDTTTFWRLPTPFIPLSTPTLLPIDQQLEQHEKAIPASRRVTDQNVDHMHLAGKILLYRALWLRTQLTKIAAQKPVQLPPGAGFTLPSTLTQAKERIHTWLSRAQPYLAAVRPLPKYRYWSEALYCNAHALILLGKRTEAMRVLKVVARTRSQARPARYSRLGLAILQYQEKQYRQVLSTLDRVQDLDPAHINIPTYLRHLSTLRDRGVEQAESVARELAVFSGKKDFYGAILRDFVHTCTDMAQTGTCLTHLVRHAPKAWRNTILSLAYQRLTAKWSTDPTVRPKIRRICTLAGASAKGATP